QRTGTGRSGHLSRHPERRTMTLRFWLALSLLGAAHAQVTFDRLLRSDQEPHNWLSYSGGYLSHRHSGLRQITPENARNLELRWVFQAQSLEKFEATPLVVDGVM